MIEEQKPFAIKNSTHFCGFFETLEQAKEHLEACRIGREDPYSADIYGPPTAPCSICVREELRRAEKPFKMTFPYGGGRDGIEVIQYLDYVETAKENS